MPIVPADFIDIHVDILRETDRAFLVSDGDRQEWLPKSQIETDGLGVGDSGPVFMPEWLAKEKGFI